MCGLFELDLDHVVGHTDAKVWEKLAGRRVFLTGGTGFVGKWLLESLLHANDLAALGIRVTVLTRDPGRFSRESPHLASRPELTLLTGDVQTFEFPDGNFPFLIHAATERQFPANPNFPASTFDADVEGTRRVLAFARTHGTESLLFTSSGAVYGVQPAELTHIPEEFSGAPATTDVRSAYGQAKRVSEFLCTMHGEQFGFSALIARLFAFVGPYLPLDENFAVGNFVGDVLAKRPIRIKGDGTPYRSYLYASDLAVWLWTILVKGVSGRPYNVGSEDSINISEMAARVASVTVPETVIERAGVPVVGARAARYVPSVRRAQDELGLAAEIPLDEGIRRLYRWAGGESAG